jgi:hypothetical protein
LTYHLEKPYFTGVFEVSERMPPQVDRSDEAIPVTVRIHEQDCFGGSVPLAMTA